MMSDLKRHSVFRATSALAIAGALLLASSNAPTLAAGNAASESSDNYTWSAKLVAYDPATRIATVQARIENHADTTDLDKLMPGQRALLTWTGLYSAAGVRDITAARDPGFERFTMPVEFAGTEMDDQYLRFRVVVPADDAAVIADLSPGEWVTALTSHQPGAWENAVLDMRPYNDV